MAASSSSSSSSSPPASKNILMLGDSLLEGYLFPSPSTPPSAFMKEMLSARFPHLSLSFVDAAYPGFQTHEILEQFHLLSKQLPRIDVVCVLGGTNDLGYGKAPPAIFRNLVALYSAVRVRSPATHVIATTIPDCAADIGTLRERRDTVNAALRDMVAGIDRKVVWGEEEEEEGGEGGAKGKGKEGEKSKDVTTTLGARAGIPGSDSAQLLLMDLGALIPFVKGEGRWTPRKGGSSLWHQDGLHFSPHGYKAIAQHYVDIIVREGLLQ